MAAVASRASTPTSTACLRAAMAVPTCDQKLTNWSGAFSSLSVFFDTAWK